MADVILRGATTLAQMRFDKRVIDRLPQDATPVTLADAYACQKLVVTQLAARYRSKPIGYKVACTNQLAREQLNVPHPLYGTLLSHSTHAAPIALPADEFTRRTIEPEFGFQMAQDVPASAEPYTAASILPFAGSLFPSIEIVDHRFEDWSHAGAFLIAADNAIHGAWVHGAAQTHWQNTDLEAHSVRLFADGVLVREGTGAAVLGSPLNVLAWLANALPEHGLALKRGDFITTGVVCDVYPGQRGETLVADFGTLGSVTLSFT